jgi:hypothetical protein
LEEVTGVGIGIGGGIGPFRAGVSTRGFGVGVGPISAGTGWGRRRRSSAGDGVLGGLLAIALGVAIVYYLVSWPYYLGTWIAVNMGAENPSTARTVVGWVLEGLFVCAALWLGSACFMAKHRTDELARLHDALDNLEAARNTEARTQEICRGIVAAIEANPQGQVLEGFGAGERHLFTATGVALIEPRVAKRGEAPVPTEVDQGEVEFTSKAVRFHSERRKVEWRFDRMVRQYVGADRLTWAVSNRKTVSGIGGSERVVLLLRGLLIWSQESAGGPEKARAYFRHQENEAASARAVFDGRIASKRAEIAARTKASAGRNKDPEEVASEGTLVP